jgi:hypothetical protein
MLQSKQYQQAANMLRGVDHPTAAKWRAKLAQMGYTAQPTRNTYLLVGGAIVTLLAVIAVAVLLLLAGGTGAGAQLTELEQAQVQQIVIPGCVMRVDIDTCYGMASTWARVFSEGIVPDVRACLSDDIAFADFMNCMEQRIGREALQDRVTLVEAAVVGEWGALPPE